VDNGCLIDEITPTTTITDQLYKIFVDGPIEYIPAYSAQLVTGCPMEYDVKIMDNGVARDPTAAELTVLTFQGNINTEDGRLIANTADFTLDG